MLKQSNSYLITDPKYYGKRSYKLKKNLIKSISKYNPTMVCLRDKKSTNLKKMAISFLKITKNKNILTFINSDIDLAYFLRFDGVHLPSHMLDKIKKAKRKKLLVVASCHTIDEIKRAKKNGADIVTYSPIFYTPQKPKPKGLNSLRRATFKAKIPLIALGGIITRHQVNKVLIKKASGFASIRYFL